MLLIKDRQKVNKILDIKIRSLYKDSKKVIHLTFLKAIFQLLIIDSRDAIGQIYTSINALFSLEKTLDYETNDLILRE